MSQHTPGPLVDIAILHAVEEDLSRAAVIGRIKRALEVRSGKRWSVTGGTGTAYGWLHIDAPPSRRTWRERLKDGPWTGRYRDDYEQHDTGQPGGSSSPADRAELGALLGLESLYGNVSVAASHDYYREYIDRAEGREPRKIATPYWD